MSSPQATSTATPGNGNGNGNGNGSGLGASAPGNGDSRPAMPTLNKSHLNTPQLTQTPATPIEPVARTQTPEPQKHHTPARLRRLASKPLKPLKLAASALSSRSGANTPMHDEHDDSDVPVGSTLPPARSTTASSFGSTSTAGDLLDTPEGSSQGGGPKTLRKRLSFTRKKHDTASADPMQVAHAASGPRRPLEGEEPAAVLRVRVVRADDLVAKDRNGFSDPFVSMIMAPATRYTTPVVKRSLNPTFPPESSTFNYPIYLSLASAIGGRGLEGVMWDKDLMRKEYMGEFHVGIDQWFGNGPVRLWHDNLPTQQFGLFSTRRRQKVSGTVTLQIGFLPLPGMDPEEGLRSANKVFDTIRQRAFTSGHMGVLGVPAYEGIGTVMMDQDADGNASVKVISSAQMTPLPGQQVHGDNHAVFDHCALNDDGLSSSEDDVMTDAVEGDDDGMLRESPMPLDHSPLDQEGAKLLAPTGEVRPSGSRRSSSASAPPTPGVAPKSGRKIFRRGKSKKRSFNFNHDGTRGVQGIVVMEIAGAHDLPKLKNALRVGWDMDPFVVISFGKKVFRTRVIRHSLNPTWEEKLLFHVHEGEENWTVQMAVLDWDKVSGNDTVGGATLPLSELMADAPKPDPKTGLYAKDEDGKHETREFTLPIVTNKSMSWESRHSPTLTVRAKYEPYDALRQRFWRQYTLQYDADDTHTMSWVELTTMLDSLGSTLTRQTMESFFTRFGKNPDSADELTVDEVVQCLEAEMSKPHDEKRKVTGSTDINTTELNDRLLASWPREEPKDKDVRPTIDSSAASTLSRPTDESKGSSQPPTDTASPDTESDADDSPESDTDVERVINIRECPLCHRPRLGKRSERDIVTHLAICASADWNRVDRIMAASYVTSSQAQRKLVTKLVNKVAVGQYSLGANSANTIVQDRVTGQLQEEKMAAYVRIGIRVLYKGSRGGISRARARKLLKSLSKKQGIKYDAPSSRDDIPAFIAFHKLNRDEILDPIDSFKTFNEFFYRKLKASARPLDEPDNPARVVSMADCRMMAFNTVNQATQIWIKGRDFTVARLLGPTYSSVAPKFNGGALAIFRLAPQDYHRFHSPVKGRVGKMTLIDGEYYTVNPQAIRSPLDVYGENVRMIVPIETEEFGLVMTVWVGAMMVGSIVPTVKEGQEVERGEELGYFAFGGSTIVLLFEPGRVVWDKDLQANAAAAIETLVRVKSGIGRAVGSATGYATPSTGYATPRGTDSDMSASASASASASSYAPMSESTTSASTPAQSQ